MWGERGPSEIIPRLWVGNKEDCKDFGGVCVNVTESAPCRWEHCVNIPVLRLDGEPRGPVAVRHRLDMAADYAWKFMRAGMPVMLHCWVGMERSPLTATWLLSKKKRMSMDAAWDIVRTQRKIAGDRRYWLTSKIQYPRPVLQDGLLLWEA